MKFDTDQQIKYALPTRTFLQRYILIKIQTQNPQVLPKKASVMGANLELNSHSEKKIILVCLQAYHFKLLQIYLTLL